MQVIQILETMALLSVGADSLTPKTKAIFLKYLNLANNNIFNETASINPDLFVNEQIQTIANSEDVNVQNKIFSISSVYWDNEYPSLNLKSFIEFVDVKKSINGAGDPQFFTFRKDIVSIYPIRAGRQYNLDIWYTPQLITLDENTAEDDIPCPISFHNLLSDEALYYLFLDEEGFKNTQKSMQALKRSEDGKKKLISYLYANSNQTLNTFSND